GRAAVDRGNGHATLRLQRRADEGALQEPARHSDGRRLSDDTADGQLALPVLIEREKERLLEEQPGTRELPVRACPPGEPLRRVGAVVVRVVRGRCVRAAA